MRYELLLQPEDPQAPFDPAALEAALSARGLTGAPEGARQWRLSRGTVEVRPLVEGGKQVGTELRVPLSDQLDLIREVVEQGVLLAREASLRLVDPQLGKALREGDAEQVAAQYLATARYAGEMLGVSEALYASIPPAPEGLQPGTKVMLGIAALVVLVIVLLEYVL